MVQEKSFVDQVRRGRVASPTIRTFDANAWRTALGRATGTADEPIIRAGLWFGEALQARWRSIEALDLRRMSLGALTREMAAVANLTHLRTIAMAEMAALELDRASLPSGSVAQVRLGAGESAATADMIRTSTIDTLGKMVAYVRGAPAPSRRDRPVRSETLTTALTLFEDVYLLEYLWGHVLWCGWQVPTNGPVLRFLRPDPDPAGRSFIIGEFRREMLLAEFMGVYAMEWARLGTRLPGSWSVQTRDLGQGAAFQVRPLQPGEGPLPPTYALRALLRATELEPYIEEPLPNLDDPTISLDDLLKCWELLALAMDSLVQRSFAKGPKAPPLTFAPTVRLADLEALLEPLGWTPQKRRAAIRHFVYEDTAPDGLWSKPLLPVGGGKVAPVFAPISCPNLLRTAELWLAEAAGERFFSRRGNEAEAKLRRRLDTGLKTRPWGQASMVLDAEWKPKIDGVGRDIDLVIRIDETVFIGEMKLKKHPVSAAEIGRHMLEFDHAAEQLDIRLKWLDQNRRRLAEQTRFDADPARLRLQGFVISGTAFGCGTQAGDYPIVDIDSLEFFFGEDAFLVTGQIGPESGYRGRADRPEQALALVQGDAATSFLAYLRHPLHVRHAEQALVTQIRRSRLRSTDHGLEWPEHHVDATQLGPATADVIAARLRAGWEDAIVKARLSSP
ncbi:hypothetical protein [Brevundimonas sp.]|uniref:hypothetical protein n=1 Tax=Brevundimonas sp. TaxID=1871086 RepID=UPI003AFFCACC